MDNAGILTRKDLIVNPCDEHCVFFLLFYGILFTDFMETEEHIHKKRNWVATVITFGVLGLLGLFIWRVLFYALLIQKGEIDPTSSDVIGSLSIGTKLPSAPIPDGEFNLVTEDDPSLGPKDAPLTIVEFGDFSCPYSREVYFVLKKFLLAHPNQIQLVYRDFPLEDLRPIAKTASLAAECAHEQGKFWELHDKIYQNQNDLSQDRLLELAKQVGINESRYKNCMNSEKYSAEIQTDIEEGFAAGVRGTPTFFINGNRVAGSIPENMFEEIFASLVSKTTYVP